MIKNLNLYTKIYELPVVSNTLPEEEKANSKSLLHIDKVTIFPDKWNPSRKDRWSNYANDTWMLIKHAILWLSLEERVRYHAWSEATSVPVLKKLMRRVSGTRGKLCDRPRASVWRWLVVEFAQWSLTWVERYILKIRWLKVPLQLCKGRYNQLMTAS